MANFRLVLRQQTDKWQSSVCTISKDKRTKDNRLGFCFPFETAAYMYTVNLNGSIYIYTENKTKGKWQFLFVCCKWETETVNSYLFAANRNGKQKFVFLGWQTVNGNWRLLFQQMYRYPSIVLCTYLHTYTLYNIYLRKGAYFYNFLSLSPTAKCNPRLLLFGKWQSA